MTYNYVLRRLVSDEVVAVDTSPNLLNYLRLGLPDCTLDVVEGSVLPVFNFQTKKLDVLRLLCLEIEKAKSNLLLYPPFCENNPFDDASESVKRCIEERGLDVATTLTHYDIVFRDRDLLIARLTIVFEQYAFQVISCVDEAELNNVKLKMLADLKTATHNN